MLVIESLPVEVRLAYTSLQAEVARLTHIIKLQGEEIRLLNLQRWGPKADKLSENQLGFDSFRTASARLGSCFTLPTRAAP